MNSEITTLKDLQKVIKGLQGYTDIFSGISERLSASPQLTEAFKKVANVHAIAFPDEIIEQMKKISAPFIKIEQAGGIIPSGGGLRPIYESNFNDFEPLPMRIRIVIDND